MDAAVRAEDRRIGIGVVARNSNGEVLGSETKVVHLGLSPQVAEALAVLQGMLFALDMGWYHVIIQSDCLEVILASRSLRAPATELGTVLNDIFVILPRFDDLSFYFHPRGCNKVAHVLANFACNFHSGARWLGSAPPCAMHEVETDLQGISPLM